MSATIERIDFHGLPAIRLQTPEGARAIVSLHGAQVLSWIPAGAAEWLYLSEDAEFAAGKAIRGGIPVCFPQFASLGALPKHGLARTCDWSLGEQQTGATHAIATLQLRDDARSRAAWPYPFVAELTVAIEGGRLDVELEVESVGAAGFEFTAALHSYLRLDDVESACLEGLRGIEYRDSADGDRIKLETGAELVVSAEIDRIYLGAPATLLLREPQRSLAIHSENFPDVVVWNPWEEKCAALADMPNAGFRRMLCVEAAAVATPVAVAAGESWWGRQTLVDLSRGE